MRIKIENQVFEDTDFKSLNFFIQLCTFENRYKLFIDITKELETTYTYKRIDIDDRKEIEEQFNSYYQNSTDESSINYYILKEESEEKIKFTINEAIRFFIQPISIILENSKNDAYFLNSVFKFLDEDNRILNYIQKGWIQFENAGGCDNIQNFLEGKLQSFNSLPKQNKSSYLRCFVLMDSDKKHQNDNLGSKKQETKDFLIENSIEIHILEKRSIENYVPIEAIETLKTNQKYTSWIEAYKSLEEPQKDFFSIENGLDKKNSSVKDKNQINTETDYLFDNILFEPLSNCTLMNGIKSKGYGNFKTNFPKLFERSEVTKENLQERSGTDELERIVRKINQLL
jgi:hypothetical protein